jgi:NADH-quinone oxidoreductase subunit A
MPYADGSPMRPERGRAAEAHGARTGTGLRTLASRRDRAGRASLVSIGAPWPLLLCGGLTVGLVAGLMLVSYVLGEKTRGEATRQIFESGIVTVGEARFRVPAKFYLMAMFFVISDLESVFIFAWAVAAREVGWAGYIEVLIFIAVLVASLAYLWRIGALEWGPSGRRTPAPRHPDYGRGRP